MERKSREGDQHSIRRAHPTGFLPDQGPPVGAGAFAFLDAGVAASEVGHAGGPDLLAFDWGQGFLDRRGFGAQGGGGEGKVDGVGRGEERVEGELGGVGPAVRGLNAEA